MFLKLTCFLFRRDSTIICYRTKAVLLVSRSGIDNVVINPQ